MSGYFLMLRQDGESVEERLLQRIAKSLEFRGPDGASVWQQDGIGGCFTLLRTGPAGQSARQPAHLGDRLFLWGDLRLDDRQELQRELSGDNGLAAPAATSEDLLLQAWQKWGPGALARIIGDFSFALWDASDATLWCARDFIGARPFYYSRIGNTFSCSNTMDLLQLVPRISRDLDVEFLGDFLTEGWNLDQTRTVYRDIRRLPAGHLLKLTQTGAEVRRFRKLPVEEPLNLKAETDYVEAYLDCLNRATQDRLPKGPAALYLSGGLDSASVCAVASQLAEQQGNKARLKAFTLSWKPFFDDPEPTFATLTAAQFGISHQVLQESELVPFEGADTGEARPPEPTEQIFFQRDRRLTSVIAAHSRVVLAGDGGDDILSGQAWPYLKALARSGSWKEIAYQFGGYFWTRKKIPVFRLGVRTNLRRWMGARSPEEVYPQWLNPQFAARTNLKHRWQEARNRTLLQEHPLHPESYAGIQDGYWSQVLEKEDAGWTRVNLETRAPLLDLRVLTFLLRLPPVPWCMNKELTRQAMKHALPAEVLCRPKSPLVIDPLQCSALRRDWVSTFPKEPPVEIAPFVIWTKWCETLAGSKGFLNWTLVRPVCLLHWLKAVENRERIQ